MTERHTTGTGTTAAHVRRVVVVALLGLAVAIPFLNREVPFVFDGALDSPGVLHLLALMLVFGALALTYDLLFGFTGLLSFGHALYFALGVYGTVVVTSELGLGFGSGVLLVLVAGLVLPLVVGAVCLRVKDIAFAMVTLAFAQAGAIFVVRDPLDVTGGELGRSLPFREVPEAFVGIVNTRNVYWLALALVVVVYVVAHVATRSPAGRVWQAIRENERRVEVLGLSPYRYKLTVLVLASFLATACGVVYVLVVGGANPRVTTSTFTLTLLVMVVLGGAGRLWGALVGGMLYTYLDHRLAELATSPSMQDLPAVVRVPLSEPLFALGVLFVIVVLFVPGGVAGLVSRVRPARTGRGGGDVATAVAGGSRTGTVQQPDQAATGAAHDGARHEHEGAAR
ncbi:branched-chain amino acid ABC transporter permease [Nocardioides flavus (ex Wang et al. 2016)]|uniref:Branched-chain amino acid ABC transporter permease n=1 Tax=Nocardioides flavus (ex Wang et al. 2016) TaxID=2058780 RepID=A0ABQ3HJI0_9ACTN|nr:branched-chain amino acid ABC transporter permease [Nocardioides flavus (ex Wang et al. 2016)]GHE17711.1 branched-chain amino acid ABC transporter permease [Nocardioides flavus (ex Wang et al. 2016)]